MPDSTLAEVQHERRRWAVVHAGRRDDYQVALALHEDGALQSLLTDFYTPDWLRRLTRDWRWVPGLNSRTRSGLPSHLTRNDLIQALGPLAIRWARIEPIGPNLWLEARLSQRASRFARRYPDIGVLCYSYYWEWLARARLLHLWNGPGVVLQVHPIAGQVRSILERDRAATGLTYAPEREELLPHDAAERYRLAMLNADSLIAASSFTARGLIDAGASPDRVAIVPYGADCPLDGRRDIHPTRFRSSHTLRLLWVGQLAYRKGAHHLFRALRRLPRGSVELTIMTRSQMPEELVSLLPDCVRVHSSVSDAERDWLYMTHDLFVMPSLVEGFGLTYLEALARGLPILCTPNSGGPDLVSHGKEGFIVEAGRAGSIADTLMRCLDDRSILPGMAERARQTARTLTWNRFRRGIVGEINRVDGLLHEA